jgi:adhesin/invasin
MLKRVSALCAIGVAVSAALLPAQDLFVLPGEGASNGVVEAFVTNPLTNYRTFTAGVGSFALLPTLSAEEFFIVGSSTESSIFSTGVTLLPPSLQAIANLPSPASQAIITPDGSLLAVAAGNLHLFDTASNSELVPGGVSQASGVNTFAVTSSLDSKALFVLGSNGEGSSQLSLISTSSYSVTATMSLSQVATAVGVGPNGLVYVSLPDKILELDPRTLQLTFQGGISVNGTPGPLVFTPDGQYAAAADQSLSGNSLLIASLATHTATDPSLGLQELSVLQVTGVGTLLALSNQGLYQITISPPSLVPITVPNLTSGGVVALTTTNDVPNNNHTAVQAVYLASASTLYQYDPASQKFVTEFPIAPNVTPGAISYAVAAAATPQSKPATLLTYGNNQTILPSASSEPLVVQVLDANNLPLSGYTVQFQISGTGATLASTAAITGSNGYALTYVNATSTSGVVTVTATAGSLPANFTLNVSPTAEGGGSPTLTIVAGQGQLLGEHYSTQGGEFGSSLQVLASDVNGNPIASLPVTFSIPSNEGTLEVTGGGGISQTVETNTSGVASVDFLSTAVPQNAVYLQSLVTASASNTNTVTFYITTFSATPSILPLAPAPGAPLTGPEGSTLVGAVQARVVAGNGGIPNVSLFLNDNNANPSLVPSVSCDAPGGVAMSDSNGMVSCDLTFGPRIGSGSFIATVGYTHSFYPDPFTVTAGAASTLQIVQGNNQTGIPGQKLPTALVVHATDSGGNTVIGAPVNWQAVTAGAVTLSNQATVTNDEGDASALATLAGSVSGPAQVTVTVGSASATFNLTVNIPSTGIQKVSGDEQTAVIDTAFPLPLTVAVLTASGNGLPGAQVNFQVTSGAATLGTSSAITDSNGLASTTVTAGATPGAITVSATSAPFSASFTLTAEPQGPRNITIVNGGSFDPNTGISPGGIATVSGMGILTGVTGVVSASPTAGQLATSFSGVTISFNGIPAPIYYVEDTNGADQVSVQVPFEVQPGSAVALTVTNATTGSATVMVSVKPLAPGVFTSVYGGKTYAVAVRPDGSQVSPTNPAQQGENIQLYVTGLGQATPTIATGAVGVPDQAMSSPLIVGLDNGGVPLISAVYGPGLIGIYVITLQVPADAQTGPYQPIGIIAYDAANTAYFAQPTYIPIQ